MITRRSFLHRAGVAAGGLLVAPAQFGCAGLPIVDAPDVLGDRVVLGLYPSQDLAAPEDAIHQALDRLDMSWLKPGDSVFVKLACNSGQRHPAVTSPTAVRAMCRALLDRGAGSVLAGDQCGTMSVRLTAGDQRFRSSRDIMAGNGLLDAIVEGGGEPHFFDEGSFDDGYVPATLSMPEPSWRDPPFIARVVTEVDHIVYLPRLASHVLTGYTHGHKIAVGWLRDDARHAMHNDAHDMYEKYTEVNYCDELRARLRLVVTLAEEVLTSGGPDTGAIAEADPRIVVASTHLANHDVVSVAMLTWAQKTLAETRFNGGVPHGPWAAAGNLALLGLVEAQTRLPWTSKNAGPPGVYFAHDFAAGITSDRSLTRAYEILGGAPRTIAVALDGEEPPSSLRAHLERTPQLDVP